MRINKYLFIFSQSHTNTIYIHYITHTLSQRPTQNPMGGCKRQERVEFRTILIRARAETTTRRLELSLVRCVTVKRRISFQFHCTPLYACVCVCVLQHSHKTSSNFSYKVERRRRRRRVVCVPPEEIGRALRSSACALSSTGPRDPRHTFQCCGAMLTTITHH